MYIIIICIKAHGEMDILKKLALRESMRNSATNNIVNPQCFSLMFNVKVMRNI